MRFEEEKEKEFKKMNNKQKITLIFMNLQSKIGNVFVENEDEINGEMNDLLTEITNKLDEAMELIAEIEEVELKEETRNETTAKAISYVIEQIIQEVSDIAYPKRIPSRTKRNLNNYDYREHLSFLMGILGDNDKPKPKCSECKGTGETFLFERNYGQERRRECTKCNGSGDLY